MNFRNSSEEWTRSRRRWRRWKSNFFGDTLYTLKVLKNTQMNFHNFSEEWTRSRRRWRSSPTRLQLQKQESHTLKTSRQTFFFLAHFEDIKANFFVAKISRRFLQTLIMTIKIQGGQIYIFNDFDYI